MPCLVAFYIGGYAIVFKNIGLCIGNIGKICFQKAKYRRNTVIVRKNRQEGPDIFYKRVQKYRLGPVYEERNIMLVKLSFAWMAITFQVPGKNRYIFLMISVIPDQFYHAIKYHLYFFIGIASAKQRYVYVI